MENHVLKNPPVFNTEMRKLETTDPAHANLFNPMLEQLLNNDAFLKAIADVAKEHMESGEIHVSAQQKKAWDDKAGTAVATQDKPGLMGIADKKKLDGVKEGAEVNQNAYSNVKVGNITITANGKTATFALAEGANITLTADNATKTITIAANRNGGNADTVDGYHAEHFAAADHGHDGQYYTETEINTLLIGKAAANHSHKEMDDLKKSVSDGKSSVAAAVTAKGVPTAADATFATIAGNVGQISSDATAEAGDAVSGKTFYAGGKKVTGSMPRFGDRDSETQNTATAQESLMIGPVGVGVGRPIRTLSGPKVIKTGGEKYLAGTYQNGEARNLYIKSGGDFVAGFPQSAVASAIGLSADKLLAGSTILGIAGTGGGGGKDVTLTGDIVEGTVAITLKNYGIGDGWRILYADNVSQSYYTGPAPSTGNIITTNGYIYYDAILYVVVDNTHVACFCQNGGGVGTYFPHAAFRGFMGVLNDLRCTGYAASRPTTLAVAKFFYDMTDPYSPRTNHVKYTTRIMAI